MNLNVQVDTNRHETSLHQYRKAMDGEKAANAFTNKNGVVGVNSPETASYIDILENTTQEYKHVVPIITSATLIGCAVTTKTTGAAKCLLWIVVTFTIFCNVLVMMVALKECPTSASPTMIQGGASEVNRNMLSNLNKQLNNEVQASV